MRLWSRGATVLAPLLVLLGALAATIASPRPAPDRPGGTVGALALSGGLAALLVLVLAYDLAVGPSDAVRTVGHALGRLSGLAMAAAATWWAIAALRPDEPSGPVGPPPPRD